MGDAEHGEKNFYTTQRVRIAATGGM